MRPNAIKKIKFITHLNEIQRKYKIFNIIIPDKINNLIFNLYRELRPYKFVLNSEL